MTAMPKMVTKYAPGEAVEVLMGDNRETDWRAGTIHAVKAIRLYQVHLPGVGYLMKWENEIKAKETTQ